MDDLSNDSKLARWLKRFSQRDGWLIVFGGGLVLLGWCLGIDVLKRLLPGLVAMNPVSAFGFIMAGFSLLCFWLPQDKRRIGADVGRVLAGLLAVLGTLKVGQYAFGWGIPFDQLLFRGQLRADAGGFSNQIAPNTAVGFILGGLALWCLNSSRGRFSRPAQFLGMALAFSSLVPLVGYLYQATYLYSLGAHIPMALYTAALFCLLAIGILCAQPDFGVIGVLSGATLGGAVARRLLPFAFGVPVTLGALSMWGEKHGLYRADFGLTMMVVASVAIFSSLVSWNAVLLNRAERARREAEAGLQRAHDELEFRVKERTAELNAANQALQAQVAISRRAEEKIREQASLLDKAHDAILVLDLQRKIVFWNKGAESLYGWTAPEVLGRDICDLLFKDACRPPAALEEVFGTGGWSGVLDQATRTGGKVIVESRWALVKDDEGSAKSVLIINTDVTEKKKYEAQVLRSQRMDSIGALAGGIAHDLNNALAPVLMSVELLKNSSDPADRDRFLDIIAASAQRGTGMVKQILRFVRGSASKEEPVELDQLIGEMTKIARDTFPKSISIRTTSAAKQLWKTRGDVTELHQVLLNLCVNARDAMPNGGRLTLAAENVRLGRQQLPSHAACPPGAYIRLSVTDTGTGIPPEVLERIFEPFYTTKEPDKGTGLGLSTVAGIVRDHGGYIDVLTKVGSGTEFQVYLPAIDTVDDPEKNCQKPSLPTGHGELILVMDDEEAVRELAKTVLENYGYRVLTALNGLEGIARFEEHRHDIKLIVSDTDMPFMDGLTAIRSIQQSKPDLPVIIASGNKCATEFLARGNHLFNLGKPYSVEALLTAVAAMVEPEASAAAVNERN
jgi:two-component system, cell cycle sensor histidine kinase and response regulator CckA